MTGILTAEQVERFREEVYSHYRQFGRKLPWRETHDPYAVLVSELMLQQTQVQRVVPKYADFLASFPSFRDLALAPLSEVLSRWQGLGYNRRALFLQRCAGEVMERFDGELPADVELLETLPGIGQYTARAVAAFAFGEPTVFIETNIRALFLHRFFPDSEAVPDRAILPLVAQTVDRIDPRHWYYALMDAGALLKREVANPGRRSAHHTRQSPFCGSNREQRSWILKALLADPGSTAEKLLLALPLEPDSLLKNLHQLQREGFLREERGGFHIA
ncbi:A/G-specific adenine glycosylase [Geomonas sp. RF6]|uniref:A/G-specific adenine glycosylase n=1 Tax=Geomonas sp. RF6 TaxID=2897342 RepID=UPI001E3B9CDD|nr:A/G-specific adenine glycosylase [Geomonas sp. RF6]UFS69907.1 A/G-specific adenine glycosylase [Geomonas sp. RF6]